MDSTMKRITIDTNVVGAALKNGKKFRAKVLDGSYQVFVAETTLTLDGLLKQGKIDLLALKDVKHAFKKSKWDDYVDLGLTFLICPRIGLTRPKYKNDYGSNVEYTLENKADEHTYSQKERQSRYFDILRYIENDLKAGKQWLSELENEITNSGGTYRADEPWFLNVANNISSIEENKLMNRFGDWADADAIAAHYAYGNDIFCTNDIAKGAGSNSVMSADNRKELENEYCIEFKSLDELIRIL